jgi:hypothetical protein
MRMGVYCSWEWHVLPAYPQAGVVRYTFAKVLKCDGRSDTERKSTRDSILMYEYDSCDLLLWVAALCAAGLSVSIFTCCAGKGFPLRSLTLSVSLAGQIRMRAGLLKTREVVSTGILQFHGIDNLNSSYYLTHCFNGKWTANERLMNGKWTANEIMIVKVKTIPDPPYRWVQFQACRVKGITWPNHPVQGCH